MQWGGSSETTREDKVGVEGNLDVEWKEQKESETGRNNEV